MSRYNKQFDPTVQRSKSKKKKSPSYKQDEKTDNTALDERRARPDDQVSFNATSVIENSPDEKLQPESPIQAEANDLDFDISKTPGPISKELGKTDQISNTKAKPSKTPESKNMWLAKHFQGIDLKSLKKSLNNDTLHYSPSKMSSYKKSAELFVLLDDDFLDRYYERTPGKSTTNRNMRKEVQESPSLRLQETSMKKEDQIEPTSRILDLYERSSPDSPDLAYTPSVLERPQ